MGIVSRVRGVTTGRVHHLMPKNELYYFYILDWSDKVADIREQYPLVDVRCAMDCAEKAGVKYPLDKESGYPYILACDFLLTTADGLKARTVKLSSELKNCRVLEKLEIERRYWEIKGIDWKIVTEKEIPFEKAKNIEWLYSAQNFNLAEYVTFEYNMAEERMLQLFGRSEYSVFSVIGMIEAEFLLPQGVGLNLFKYLVFTRRLEVDLCKHLDLNAKGTVTILCK